MAFLAPSLVNLRTEINRVWPNRDKGTDGWIGDKAHQARQSDHNPDKRGMVHAIDIDKDGIDPMFVVGKVIANRSVTSYVVYNRTIWSIVRSFKPIKYTGSNPHTSHIHVSILYTGAAEGWSGNWGIGDSGIGAPHVPQNPVTDDMQDWSEYFDNAKVWMTWSGDSLHQNGAALKFLGR